MAEVFYEGSTELATLTNTFSVNDTPTDPDAVTLVVTDPTGEQTTYDNEIDNSGVGVYTIDVACTVAGIWSYVWVGTGIASDVVAGTWTVFSVDLNTLYFTPEELKSRFAIPDTADDFEIRLALDAACRWLDDEFCFRHFWRGESTRTFVASGCDLIEVDDLVSITTLKTDPAGDGTFETTWSASDYQLLPINATTAHAEARPYTQIKAVGSYIFPTAGFTRSRDDRVQIEGVFGWPQVPAGIKMAAAIIGSETFKLKDTFAGRGGFGEFVGEAVRRNPAALDYAKPYRKHAVLVA